MKVIYDENAVPNVKVQWFSDSDKCWKDLKESGNVVYNYLAFQIEWVNKLNDLGVRARAVEEQ